MIDPAGRGWLDNDPTEDEQDILAFLKTKRSPKRLLHVGVGTSLLFREFGSVVVQGLTKDGVEAEVAKELGYEAILCNKYDVDSYCGRIKGPFDVIVDGGLRCYACCDVHFLKYMEFMCELLQDDGVLITGARGLDYLIPTTLNELRSLLPHWSVSSREQVVIMKPRKGRWLMALRRLIRCLLE